MKKWNLVVGNKPKARVLSVLLAVTMSFSLFGCGQTASDKANSEASAAASEVEEEAKDAASETVTNPSHSSESGKDETVYIVTDASGNPTNITVNDQLKNKDGKASLVDKTDLKDIVNVNGDGSYKENDDGTITWETGSADVYYQGTTDKTLPVTVSLSYQLDGKDIRPEDLAGKSGHVKIRFDYKNTATVREKVGDKEEDVTVPFAMISGAILPMDKFTNVSVTNGKIMGDGQNNIVVGMAFPGLKDALDWENLKEDAKDDEARKKLDDVDIPEYVEIEADVKDFALDMTMTMASSNILSDLGGVDDIDVSSVTDKMNDLQDGTDKLEDGAKKLKNGTSDLKDGVTELADGTSDMKDGTSDLRDGASKLKDGTSDLRDGASDLKDGTSDLVDGASSLKNGTAELKNGASDLKNGTSRLKNGTSDLKSGMKKLSDGAATLKNGTSSLSAGTNDLKDGTEKLSSGAKTLSGGAGTLADGLTKLASATSGLDSKSAGAMESGLSSLVGGLYKVQAGVKTAAGAISDGTDTSSATLIGGLKAMSLLSATNETEAGRANENLDSVISYLNAHQEKDITPADILSARNGLCTQYQTMLGTLTQLGYDTASTPDVSGLAKTLSDKTAAYQKAASAYADAYAAYKTADALASNAADGTSSSASPAKAAVIEDEEDFDKEDQSAAEGSEGRAAGTKTSSDATGHAAEDESTTGNAGTDSTGTAGSKETADGENGGTSPADGTGSVSTESTGSSVSSSASATDSSASGNASSPEAETMQSTEAGGDGLTTQIVTLEDASPEVTSISVDDLKKVSDDAYAAMTKAAAEMADAQTAYTGAIAAQTILDQNPDSVKANIDKFNTILAVYNVTIPEDQKYSVYTPAAGGSSDASGASGSSDPAASGTVTYGKALDSAISAKESVGTIKANESILRQSQQLEMQSLTSLYKTLNGTADQIGTDLNLYKPMLSKASQMIGSLPTLSSGIQSAAAGASQLSAGAQSLASGAAGADAGAAKLQAGAKELDTGAGTLKSGIDSANSGTGNLYDGAVSLDDGAGKLYSGSASLYDGAGSLYNGAVKLNDGAGTLYDGTVDLDNGAGDLYDGVIKLDDGAQDLYDGAKQLLDGSGDLDDGTQKLLDGIVKLNDEGIKKLTDLFGDNVQDAVDRIKAVKNASNDYQTFTEIAPSEDKDAVNTVKFVYRTAAVRAE